MRKKILFSLIVLSLYLVMAGGPGTSSQAVLSASSTPALQFAGGVSLAKVTSDMGFGRMPLYFTQNKGQLDNRVFYYVQGLDKTLYFGSEGLTYVLREPEDPGKGSREPDRAAPLGMTRDKSPAEVSRSWVLKLDFVGANPGILPEGLEETGAVISYFKGPKEEWKTGLPTYFKVAYRELWPGIDLIFSGRPQELKHEFVVKPGADPSLIRLGYRGAESVRVNDSGELEIKSPVASFKDGKPVAWQDVDGRRREVSLAYRLELSSPGAGPQGSIAYGFQVGSYDRGHSLILDPATLIYCGYIGGSSYEGANGIAVDGSGNAYVTGEINSTETTFPETVGPDLTANGGTDAFVAKVKSDGTGLIYCGFIGGSNQDFGEGIAVDGSGNAYVTGRTFSSETSFPVSRGPDLTHNGIGDAFVAKVKSDGMGLDYCGYIGGSGGDYGEGIAVDGLGNASITGYTDSSQTTFPETVGPDLTHNGGYDAFVAKVKSDGTGLIYCGYIGGSGNDYSDGIAVDGSGNAYITGYTASSQETFPVTVGPDLTFNSFNDAFVAKIRSDGTGLIYSGYIGGSYYDSGHGIAVDGSGNAYVTGLTDSRIFPEIVGPDLTFNGSIDAFVAKVKSDGTGLIYCGYIGGSGNDYGLAIAVDGSGNASVTGFTNSSETTFPVSRGPDLTYNGGDYDAFVAKVRSDGTGLNYCGYIGGSSDDRGYAIAVDGSGNAYATGYAYSSETTFPVTVGPDLTHNGGTEDAFVAKISALVADISVSKSVDNINPVLGDTVNFTVTVTNLGPDDATGVKVKDVLPAGLGFVSASASHGTYTETSGLWTVGLLTNGSSASLTLGAKVNIQGALTNTAAVVGVYETDPNAENDTASVTVSAQYRAYPPSNFQLARLENDLIFFKEYVNRLSWVPNPLNLAAIVNYRLYRKAKDQPNTAFALYQELNASATSFDDRGLKNDELFTYRITSVSEAGIESQPVEAGN